ncbi:STAS domain-containing protein [Oricola sp.]|uniref:STAS domain-containing protein n=1 Tax=Oricola sp. TaxID=1979950 RepID=UPI003BABC050
MVKQVAENPLAIHMEASESACLLTLPEALPGEDAGNIADVILNVRNKPLSIDAGKVERVDTPCIQVLMSAANLWREDGEVLHFSEKSGTFGESISTLGLTLADLEAGDANHA